MTRLHIIIILFMIFLIHPAASAQDLISADNPPTITLSEAMGFAMSGNLELQAATEALTAAQFGVKAADALDWFSLTLVGSSAQSGPSQSIDIPGQGPIDIVPNDFIHSATLNLSQPIYTFGLNKNLKKVANLSLGITQADYDTKLNEIKLAVETSYYDLLFLKELIAVQEQNLERAENDLKIAQLRHDAGQVAKFEVIRADVAVKNAQEVLIGTRKNFEIAKLAWQRILGVDSYMEPDADELLTFPITQPLSFTLEEAKTVALENRPELRKMHLSVESMEIAAQLKSLRPDLRFNGSYGLASEAVGFGEKESWRLMFNLNWPLWDGGRADSQFNQGMHQVEQLTIQEKDLEELIGIEVADAYLTHQEAVDRLDATFATLMLAQEAKRMAELGYQEGVVTQQELLSTEVDLAQAKVNRLKALYDYLKNMARLVKALGGKYIDDVGEIQTGTPD